MTQRLASSTLLPPLEGTDVSGRIAALEKRLAVLAAQVRQAQQLAGIGTAAMTAMHEVNNLLTPVKGYARGALSTNELDFKDKALRIALRNIETAVAMSDRLLAIGAAKPTQKEDVVLKQVVIEAVESLCRDLAKDGIQLTVNVDDGLGAHVDPLQIRQVLFNTLLNAREALAPLKRGRITITGRRDVDSVVVEIRDTGPGIPRDLLPHVFEPLQSSKSAIRDANPRCGGLGLALCKDLVESNGGTITVSSTGGEGTTFTIHLPPPD